MPSTIYNEGRVVGYSAYEVYVRHAISEGMEPVSEKEWLSATLTDGSSLLLQLTPNQLDKDGNALGSSGSHIIDIPLPETNKYELTTSEPEDWKTRWDRYYTLNGNVYVLVSSFPVPIWESGKYYIGTAPTWVEDKYYELNDDQYELLTSRPVTWGYRWMYYYESDDGGQTFKPVVGSSYTPIDNQPADWSINWDTYFERTGTSPDYTYVLATNWRPNMYYRKVETHVTAANTIVASFFMGEGYYENTDDFWATHVKSYGPLLKNDVAYSADEYLDAAAVEYTTPSITQWNSQLASYANIVDGDVIVSGTWMPRSDSDTQPANDFKPDLSDTASPTILRLYLKAPLLTTINILFTGFMLKSILRGMTNITDGSTDTNYPEDGDFLGPSNFPWGNKVVFSIPPACIESFLSAYTRTIVRYESINTQLPPSNWTSGYYNYYQRCKDTYSETVVEPNNWSNIYKNFYTKSGNDYIPITSSTAPTWQASTYYAGPHNGFISLNGIVNSAPAWESGKYYRVVSGSSVPHSVDNMPVVDLSLVPQQYYSSNYTDSPIDFTVNGINASGNNVLTVYSRYDILPPALYSSFISSTGDAALYPVDTVAPGTVKIFEDDNKEDEASAVNDIDGNIGMYRDENYIIHQTVPSAPTAPTDPIANTYVTELDADRFGGQRPYALEIVSGKKSNMSIPLQDTSGKVLPRTGIHPPEFNSGLVYELNPQGNMLVGVTTEPTNWETSYASYYWDSLQWWQGDGTTTTFTLSGTVPERLKGVAVDDYIKREGVDWSYSNGVLTFQTAPAYDTTITTYVSPPDTFETMNPLSTIGNEKFIERTGTLHWDDLLFALANNKAIDLFNNSYFLKRFAEVLSDKLVAGKGIAVSTNLPGQPSGTSVISSDIIAGAGISINQSNNSLKITNTTVDKSVLPEMVSGDYYIYVGYDDGCCGMFHFPDAPEDAQDTFDTLSYDHLRIRYSPSGDGNSAQIYINTRATLTYTNKSIVEKTAPAQLQCESFKRFTYSNPEEQFERLDAIYSSVPNFYPHMFFSSADRTEYETTQPDDWSTNWGNYYAYKNQFRLRHSYSNDAPWDEEPPTVSPPDNSVPYQLTRILRIVFNLDNVVNGKTLAERLGMANTTITGATDTSQEITGVWNVRSTLPEDSGPMGASWEAVCRTEFAPDTTGTNHPGIFIYGLSYSDGYNDQVGDSVLTVAYDSAQPLPTVYLDKKYPNGVFIDNQPSPPKEYKLYGQYINIGVSALLTGSNS